MTELIDAVGEEVPFEVSLEGRVSNLSLAPSPLNALWPIFEAVTNAIQSIEERFAEKKSNQGVVRIIFDQDKEGVINSVTVSDNGIGLNRENFKSFCKSDSRLKAKKGGKGVGRLTYLKVFERAIVNSVWKNENKLQKREFYFEIREGTPIHEHRKTDGNDQDVLGTSVILESYRTEYKYRAPRKADTIARHFIRHFINYVIAQKGPKISLEFNDEIIELREYFKSAVNKTQTKTIKVKIADSEEPVEIKHMLLDKGFKDPDVSYHCCYLLGDKRVVERYELDGQLGLTYVAGGFVYIGVVNARILDKNINQERTGFYIDDKSMKELKRGVIEAVLEFLSEDIVRLRSKQAETISKLLSESPRFINLVGNDSDGFAREKLNITTQKPEDIYLELSRYARREIITRKNSMNAERKSQHRQHEITTKTKEYIEYISKEGAAMLADYMSKRKSVIDILSEALQYVDNDQKRSELEEVIHDIICPLRSTSDKLNYEDHNLWIINDRLAYYSYFASDKRVDSIMVESNSGKETDITFFDLGLGFHRKSTTEPVIIVEFKRPRRNDYGTSIKKENPVFQLLKYVNEIRKGGAVTAQGSRISSITESTPFIGYIIADIEDTLKSTLMGTNFQNPTPDGRGFYGYDGPSNTFIEIIPYDKLIDDAVLRHEKFFERLGINNG